MGIWLAALGFLLVVLAVNGQKLYRLIDRRIHPLRYLNHAVCRECGYLRHRTEMIYNEKYVAYFCNTFELRNYWRHR